MQQDRIPYWPHDGTKQENLLEEQNRYDPPTRRIYILYLNGTMIAQHIAHIEEPIGYAPGAELRPKTCSKSERPIYQT